MNTMAQYLDRRGKDANGSGRPGNEQLAEAAGNTVAADIEHAICPAAVEYIGDALHDAHAERFEVLVRDQDLAGSGLDFSSETRERALVREVQDDIRLKRMAVAAGDHR